MSAHTDKLMAERGVTADGIWLPAGGVAVFGKTGNGKSTLFRESRFVGRIIIADSGSMMHKMWAGEDKCKVIDTAGAESPVEQVRAEVEAAAARGVVTLLDSWSTLQELQVLWYKRVRNIRGTVTIPQHGDIVAMLRDLIPTLAMSPVFTLFNTTSGGESKTPQGEIVRYPAGALTGYQSLNGTEPNKETILARWGNVWGVFQGHPAKELPRGLYVPGNDIRPESYSKYAPLKDPLEVIKDTTQKGIMAVPDRNIPESAGRCFVDELLVEIAAKYPRKRPAPAATTAAAGRAQANGHPEAARTAGRQA